MDDRHDVVNSGFWDGREAVIANLRALADSAPTSFTVVATRGERLVLTRMCSPNRNQQYGDFSSDMFILAEINAEELISAQVGFNIDDIDVGVRGTRRPVTSRAKRPPPRTRGRWSHRPTPSSTGTYYPQWIWPPLIIGEEHRSLLTT